MRFVLAMVLAGLAALPLSASAQAGEESTEPNVEEPAPPSEPAPEEPPPSLEPTAEEPALQLELDAAGVEVVPTPPRTADGYTLEEMELRVKRARIGLGVSFVPMVVGAIVYPIHTNRRLDCAFSLLLQSEYCDASQYDKGLTAGVTLIGVGTASVIATAVLLGVRKRKLRELQEAHYGTPRRVQWDLARSRLVF